jgi:hypothetical protein
VTDPGVVGGRPDSTISALLETVILEAPVAFAFFDVTSRFRCVSQALADLNHRPISAHLNRLPTEVLPEQMGRDVEGTIRRVLSSGSPIASSDFVADVPEWGGLQHFEARWLPVRGAGGVVGVVVFVNDVTERRRSEDALRRSQARTTRLQMVTAELASALTVDEVVAIIANVGRFSVGADRSEVALLEEQRGIFGWQQGGRPTRGWPQPPESWPLMLSLAVREARPLYFANPAELAEALPRPEIHDLVAASAECAWAVLPLTASGAPLGALRFAFRRERYIDTDDRVFLEALAGQCALALERARLYEREHRAAVSLQRSLLPEELPVVPGLQIAFRYLPGAADAEVGGDWYDAFRLPGGRVAAVVGDVIGKGLTAAAGMGRVRSALRALAFTDDRPAVVLSGLDALFTATEREESLTTVVYAVVNPATGAVEATHAGHLPMLLITADGEPSLIDAAPASLPLGLAEPRTQRSFQLRPGDTLVGFSDGLVENHARGLAEGLERLVEAARGRGRDELESLVTRLVGHLLANQERDDDVTVLALRLTGEHQEPDPRAGRGPGEAVW